MQHTHTHTKIVEEKEIYAIQLKSLFNEDKTRQTTKVNTKLKTVKTICLLKLTKHEHGHFYFSPMVRRWKSGEKIAHKSANLAKIKAFMPLCTIFYDTQITFKLKMNYYYYFYLNHDTISSVICITVYCCTKKNVPFFVALVKMNLHHSSYEDKLLLLTFSIGPEYVHA